jgi:hypothetical protein
MTAWIIIVAISVVVLAAEAVFILPDKMPWNRKKDKHGQ